VIRRAPIWTVTTASETVTTCPRALRRRSEMTR
jgi:hypothetical protein